MLKRVWIKYNTGEVREVFEGFYLDNKHTVKLTEAPEVVEEISEMELARIKWEDAFAMYMEDEEEDEEEYVVPKDKSEIELLRDELDAKGIPYHPSCKLETLKKKLEG